jgi:hypothetical protein
MEKETIKLSPDGKNYERRYYADNGQLIRHYTMIDGKQTFIHDENDEIEKLVNIAKDFRNKSRLGCANWNGTSTPEKYGIEKGYYGLGLIIEELEELYKYRTNTK